MTTSHVDDGGLHAYLDGALDAYPQAEAARIRRHLEACAACAARLDGARAVRTRANDILSGGQADGVDAPPLEELRRRAAATAAPARSRLGRLRALGWAASVVLALGTGWLLRGEGVGDRAAPPVPTSTVADPVAEAREALRPAAPVEPTEDRPVGVATQPVGDVVVGGGEGVAARPAAFEGQVTVQAARPADDRPKSAPASAPSSRVARPTSLASGTSTAARAEVPARPSPALPSAALDARLGTRTVPSVSPPSLPLLQIAALAPAASDDADADRARRSGPSRDALVITSEQRGVAEAESRESALDRARRAAARLKGDELGSLVIPGLELVSVSWVELPGAGEAAVRVLQLLATGDTVEVLHLPPGVQPDAAPGADGNRTRLEIEGPEGWLVVRGRASGEELGAMLERLLAS